MNIYYLAKKKRDIYILRQWIKEKGNKEDATFEVDFVL